MATIKVATVYQGESIRSDNGSQVGMPIFGRYAAIVREREISIWQTDDGRWMARLGDSGVAETLANSQEEAVEAAQRMATHGGWHVDFEAARADAIAAAKARHNDAAQRPTYAAKFGGPID